MAVNRVKYIRKFEQLVNRGLSTEEAEKKAIKFAKTAATAGAVGAVAGAVKLIKSPSTKEHEKYVKKAKKMGAEEIATKKQYRKIKQRLKGQAVLRQRAKIAKGVLPLASQIAEYRKLGGGKTPEGRAYRRKWMAAKKRIPKLTPQGITPIAKAIVKSERKPLKKKKSKLGIKRQEEDRALRGALGPDYAKWMKKFQGKK